MGRLYNFESIILSVVKILLKKTQISEYLKNLRLSLLILILTNFSTIKVVTYVRFVMHKCIIKTGELEGHGC
jgi:hypothetical protein